MRMSCVYAILSLLQRIYDLVTAEEVPLRQSWDKDLADFKIVESILFFMLCTYLLL